MTIIAQPDFFTEADFKLISNYAGRRRDKNNSEHQQVFKALKSVYSKVNYWAQQIAQTCFPNGVKRIRQNPLNQAQQFERYQWAQIYPDVERHSFGKLAFTVDINENDRLTLKIDTIRLGNGDAIRERYFTALGDFDNSPMVKHYGKDEVLKGNWNALLDKSIFDINNELAPLYEQFYKQINASTSIAVEEVPPLHSVCALNTILYGPPGTGKTYTTINKALEILGIDTSDMSREEMKKAFDGRISAGQIYFTTFHQSMSYEDFIEGIKPEYDETKQLITYPVKDGIFKRACLAAIKDTQRHDVMMPEAEPDFDTLYDSFIQQLKRDYRDDAYPFITKDGYEMRIKKNGIHEQKIVVYYRWSDSSKKDRPGVTPFTVRKEKLQRLYDAGITGNEDNITQALGKYIGYHFSAHYAVYKGFLAFVAGTVGLPLSEKQAVPLQPKKLEDYMDDLIATGGDGTKRKSSLKPYVLIIDEINRGNIAQIFGELITLLEEGKRLGEVEGLEVVLPYSKERFSVPANLYVIGTMNTADRSVEALDTALRRRFVFEEMVPQPLLLASQRLLWQFWWDHKDFVWEDKPYVEVERPFYELIGFNDRASGVDKGFYWGPMDEDGTPAEYQIEALTELARTFTGVRLDRLLECINSRIESLLGRDYMIGHAYFINVRSIKMLREVFLNKIIPLLQEYFYNDYGRIGLVLGDKFIKVTPRDKIGVKTIEGYDTSGITEGYNYIVRRGEEFVEDDVFIRALMSVYE